MWSNILARLTTIEKPTVSGSAPPESPAEKYPDIAKGDLDLIASVSDYTMTSVERCYHLMQSVRYIERYNVPGDIVECGVWRGGSIMLAARCLADHGVEPQRHLYLYDTFQGMPAPTDADLDFRGNKASGRLDEEVAFRDNSVVWAIATLDDVKANVASTKYPADRVHYIEGLVEQTIPATIPENIALLRLDTDWYESTAHELRHLFPRVSPGGVVIIDDYGYWQGARKAVDEFIEEAHCRILLNRIDNTGRAFIKEGI